MSQGLPKTLEEAFKALDELLSDEDRRYLQEADDPDEAAVSLHHTLGRHIRNKWGFWQDSELKRHIRQEHGILHPDDMSGFILREYCRARYPTRHERLMEDE